MSAALLVVHILYIYIYTRKTRQMDGFERSCEKRGFKITELINYYHIN